MTRQIFVLASLAVAATLSAGGAARGQSGGYPYWGTAPQNYQGPDVVTPRQTITPNTVSSSAHSRPRHDPDHTYYGDGLGAGITGGRLPGFLAREDARTDRVIGDERPDNTARVRLRVPAGAEVWVDGVKTRQTGATRQFFSPPLTPGKKYAYDVRVRWDRDGEPAEQRRRIAVAAGQQVEEDFTRPTRENKASK